jgi:glutaredoxin
MRSLAVESFTMTCSQTSPLQTRATRQGASALRTPLLLGLVAALAATPAWALYKVVGPDGKVTYTDRPPSDKPAQALRTNGSVSATANLPFELRQIAIKYPVTLYTAKDCGPCDIGRQSLRQRGIPFTEKSVETNTDIQALQRLEGTQQLPVLRVGSQQVKGYSESEWQSYLDAAGYPKQSALSGYQWADATPLAPPAASAPVGKAAPAGTGAATGGSGGTAPASPGFRF